MASEHKPGDRVLVEAQIDKRGRVYIKYDHGYGWVRYDPASVTYHPHPGIDPALIGELVEAVRRWVIAECNDAIKHATEEQNRRVRDEAEAATRHLYRVAQPLLPQPAARMDAKGEG